MACGLQSVASHSSSDGKAKIRGEGTDFKFKQEIELVVILRVLFNRALEHPESLLVSVDY